MNEQCQKTFKKVLLLVKNYHLLCNLTQLLTFFRLMEIIGLSQKGRLLYKEFVELFQDAEENTKYQESSHTLVIF